MKKLKKLNLKKSFKKFKKSKLFLVVVLALVGGLVWLSLSVMAGETQISSEARAKKCSSSYCSPSLSRGRKCDRKKVGATLSTGKCVKPGGYKRDSCKRPTCEFVRTGKKRICGKGSHKKCIGKPIGFKISGGTCARWWLSDSIDRPNVICVKK